MRLTHRDCGPGFTHQDSADCACRPVKVRTSFDYPPIPLRQFDWSATTDDYDASWEGEEIGYVSRHPVGHGATEDEAVADLMAQIEE